jgi:hypothetical protein
MNNNFVRKEGKMKIEFYNEETKEKVSSFPKGVPDYVHMCISGKVRPIETIPGLGRGARKENVIEGEFKYELL